jgi:hypothetical protein
MEMYMLMPVDVCFVVAGIATQSEFHGAAGVGNFVYQSFFVEGI